MVYCFRLEFPRFAFSFRCMSNPFHFKPPQWYFIKFLYENIQPDFPFSPHTRVTDVTIWGGRLYKMFFKACVALFFLAYVPSILHAFPLQSSRHLSILIHSFVRNRRV